MTQQQIMTADEFLGIARQYTNVVDEASVAKIYLKWRKSDQDVHTYICAHLPTQGQVAIATLCGSDMGATYRVCKWLAQQKMDVQDTLCGPYTTSENAQKLEQFLQTAIPIYPVFVRYYDDHKMPVTAANYNRFLLRCKGKVSKTWFHPNQPEYREFWTGPPEMLTAALQSWVAKEKMNDEAPFGYQSVCSTAERMHIKAEKLLDWLEKHPDFYTLYAGQYILPKEWVDEKVRSWTTSIDVADLISNVVADMPPSRRDELKKRAMEWVTPHVLVLRADQYPQCKGMRVAAERVSELQESLREHIYSIPIWPLGKLQDCTGCTLAQLRDQVACGNIYGVCQDGGTILVSTAERHRVQNIANAFVALDEIVNEITTTKSLFNISMAAHRKDLCRFGEGNNWWGLRVSAGAKIPINKGRLKLIAPRDEKETLSAKLLSWVMGYRQSDKTQFQLLLDHYRARYPKIVTILSRHYAYAEINRSIVDMTDLLLFVMRKDLQEVPTDTQEAEIENIINGFKDATLASKDELADFLFAEGLTLKEYTFDRTGYVIEKGAYPIRDFAIMVAPIVNDAVIAELGLIQKAIAHPRFARLWLYVAVHVFAAWRNPDYDRLRPPVLPYTPRDVLERISNGTYSAEDAKMVANSFVADHKLRWMRPHKTERASGVAPLYFFCPENCKVQFGIILSIAAAHYCMENGAKPFIIPECKRTTILQFFGPIFLRACGNQNWSGRRANKSLMQAVEYEGREGGRYNPLVAYTLASQLRSHKVSYGSLAETTDIYLRDSNFAGLSAEYVLNQMFQRGVCSFATDVMLQKCYGDQYKNLSVCAKTEAILAVGLPLTLQDKALRVAQFAVDTAVTMVESLGLGVREMEDTLRTIAAGRAHGKDMETQCLAKACDQECKCPARRDCLGCKYEIPSKALLLRYLLEHQRCQSDTQSAFESSKKSWLDEHIIMPKIAEIAAHLKGVADAKEMQLYIDLIQEVETDVITSDCME